MVNNDINRNYGQHEIPESFQTINDAAQLRSQGKKAYVQLESGNRLVTVASKTSTNPEVKNKLKEVFEFLNNIALKNLPKDGLGTKELGEVGTFSKSLKQIVDDFKGNFISQFFKSIFSSEYRETLKEYEKIQRTLNPLLDAQVQAETEIAEGLEESDEPKELLTESEKWELISNYDSDYLGVNYNPEDFENGSQKK